MTRILSIRLLCRDPDAAAAFYRDAFDARWIGTADGVVRLCLGEEHLDLAPARSMSGDLPRSPSTAFQHFAIITCDMNEAMKRLGGVSGWRPISRAGPERLPEASGGATTFKFHDLDGHPLELLSFPDGRVPKIWRMRAASDPGRVCLGIDHTALTVADTAASVAFYEALGFRRAASQINTGPEQARLDDVAQARVEVTTLLPEGGAPPHLELLCYAEPVVRSDPASDGSVFATKVYLEGPGPARDEIDPDGHRFTMNAVGRTNKLPFDET